MGMATNHSAKLAGSSKVSAGVWSPYWVFHAKADAEKTQRAG